METKEVKITIPEGYEIDKENSTSECIKFKKKVNDEINTWKDIKSVKGYYIDFGSSIAKIESNMVENSNKNIFISEKYAKAALALAQISQLMPYYGGEITDEEWSNSFTTKYVISVYCTVICKTISVTNRNILAFHTPEQRDRFLSFPENVQLVKDLFMID